MLPVREGELSLVGTRIRRARMFFLLGISLLLELLACRPVL
jgi:hypothetical protein